MQKKGLNPRPRGSHQTTPQYIRRLATYQTLEVGYRAISAKGFGHGMSALHRSCMSGLAQPVGWVQRGKATKRTTPPIARNPSSSTPILPHLCNIKIYARWVPSHPRQGGSDSPTRTALILTGTATASSTMGVSRKPRHTNTITTNQKHR